MNGLTPAQQQALDVVARDVRVEPTALYALLRMESNFDPQAHNPLPGSSARGLLQWTDARAKELGFNSSLDLVTKYPSFVVQMYGPVNRELAGGTPYPTAQSLFMYIFYPKARDWPPDKSFPDKILHRGELVDWTDLNPYRTPGEYVRAAYKLAGLPYTEGETIMPRSGMLFPLLAAGIVLWALSKRG